MMLIEGVLVFSLLHSNTLSFQIIRYHHFVMRLRVPCVSDKMAVFDGLGKRTGCPADLMFPSATMCHFFGDK